MACTGELGTVSLGIDLTGLADTPTSVEISGNFSGEIETDGAGELFLTSPVVKDDPFAIRFGSFDKTILPTSLPPLGMNDVAGSLALTLAPGGSNSSNLQTGKESGIRDDV